jgi:hypothetical protein
MAASHSAVHASPRVPPEEFMMEGRCWPLDTTVLKVPRQDAGGGAPAIDLQAVKPGAPHTERTKEAREGVKLLRGSTDGT